MRSRLRTTLAAGASAALAATVLVSTPALAGGGHHGGGHGHGAAGDRQLQQYAEDTWQSFVAMTDDRTGLPADLIEGDLTAPSVNTSPTNIGGYLWSAVVARDLGIIDKREARQRIEQTLDTLESLERHEPSGQFYNWYSIHDGSKLTTWPGSGDVVHPFLSSVDNGWLAASLRVVAGADRKLAKQADALYESMDFCWYHDTEAADGAGLNRGGFWVDQPGDTCTIPGNYSGDGSGDVLYTCHHYDTTVSEARIATYLGIANGQIPESAYYATYRTMPESCYFGWQEQKPQGQVVDYDGTQTYEGTYGYAGMRLVPSWGGSMFEALMPDLFIPEADWGDDSWAVNHPAFVEAQRHHGMEEAGYGYWGFSPSSNPIDGYREYGVDAIGIGAEGYASDVESTDVDLGYEGCREATNPSPEFGDGVVTPHASFLALPYDREAVLDNLSALKTDFDSYGEGGFYDAIAVGSSTVAERYLSLDQAMIMAAIGNELSDDSLKDYFVDRDFERAVRPLVEAQQFGRRLDD